MSNFHVLEILNFTMVSDFTVVFKLEGTLKYKTPPLVLNFLKKELLFDGT